MKKIFFSVLIIIFSFPVLVFAQDKNTIITYDVKAEITFNNQSIIINEKINAGDKLLEPSHIDINGYTFVGWFNGEHKWDFNTDVVTNHTTLIAKYIKDDNNNDNSINSNETNYNDSNDKIIVPNTSDNIHLIFILLVTSIVGFIALIIYEKKQ